ncbi:MATE family efflux transporter [Novosphingobium sp. PC22D]|uniref:MATE family efflux transporter n=1 Tax=Novosphingobium sp. PC22D TaxID=1962403 RepID=UPI000BF0D2CD|nr:MATE family efflux transporter [Novosphingobium sp. PC22D]PEQ14197.1 MATE family efflux transporter [Novosphingobium sp. PC22D]
MSDVAFLDLPPERPWRGEFAATLRLSWPLALANLLQMLTYAIDVIFIARLGPEQLAASSLSVAYFGLVTWGLIGLTGAAAPLMAAELGARAPALRAVRRVMRMALWLAVLSGAAGMGLCLLAGQLMRATGQDPAIAAMAREYMSLLLLSTIPMVAASVLRTFVSALGRPVVATVITAGGIGVNALGNYALIFGNFGVPALGLRGAAIATLLTSLAILAAYFAAIALDPRMRRYRILGNWWRIDADRLAQLARVGTPIALTVVAEGGIFGAAAFMMGRFGATQLAAHTVALQLAALAFQVPFGVSQAATIRVGYFFGARDRAGVARAGWVALAIGTGFMATTALAMLLVPEMLLSLYIDPSDPANAVLVAFALRYLAVAAGFQLFDGVQSVAAGVLRGLQDTRVPMVIAIFAYWVPGCGTAMVLGFATGLHGLGVWIGLAFGLVAAALLLVSRWHRRERLGLFDRAPHGPVPPIVH